MPLFTDQTGRTVAIDHPTRIVSLVPSLTELLHDLGLDEEVRGITKFCVHPRSWFRKKTRVGGTKQLHAATIASLDPDLIIANKEENVKEQVEALCDRYPVWISDIHNLRGALEAIRNLGEITGRKNEGVDLAEQVNAGFNRLSNYKATAFDGNGELRPRAAYLIWRDPYMTAGGDTFIHEMMQYAGLQNAFQHRNRYPAVTVDEMIGCDIILLSSEPYPFTEKHKQALEEILPGIPVLLVDGEIFSWYGSRLLQAPAYFEQLRPQVLSLIHAGNR